MQHHGNCARVVADRVAGVHSLGMKQPTAAPDTHGPPGTVIAAAILMSVKAVLGIWAALVLFTATPIHRRRFLSAVVRRHHPRLGLVLLVFVAAALVLFPAPPIRRRRFPSAEVGRHHPGLGLVLLVFVAATMVVLVGLLTLR